MTEVTSDEYFRYVHQQEGWGLLSDDYMIRHQIEQTPGASTYFIQDHRGGRVAVEVTGPEDGYPIFFCHGTPGSRLGQKPVGAELPPGIRLITPERPGYGFSQGWVGNRVLETVRDYDLIARYFGYKEYSAAGRSGGARYALGMAARLPGMRSAAMVVPPAPLYERGETGPFNTYIVRKLIEAGGAWSLNRRMLYSRLFALPLDGTPTLQAERAQALEELVSVFSGIADEVKCRAAALREGQDIDEIREVGITRQGVPYHAAAFRFGGVVGRMNDYDNSGVWGFDFSEVAIPTFIWAAEGDQFCSVKDAEFIASRIGSAATLHLEKNADHYTGVAATAHALQWCLEAAGRVRT